MLQHDLDAIIFANLENVLYVSGFFNPVQEARPTELNTFYVYKKGFKPAVVIAGASIGLINALDENVDVIPFAAFPIQGCLENVAVKDQRAVDAVNRCVDSEEAAVFLLLNQGGDKAPVRRIGVDFTSSSWIAFHAISLAAPTDVAFVDIQPLIAKRRMVKRPEEIKLIREAAHIAEQSFITVLPHVIAGVTERELHRFYEMEVVSRGGSPFFAIIGINEHGAYPNWTPGDTAVKPGDVIRFDIGCKYCNYCADIARTVVLGPVKPKYVEYYNAVLAGYEAALSIVKPGVKASDVFRTGESAVHCFGLKEFRRLHCGHTIGLNLYEGLLIAPNDDRELEAGMTFCLEIPFYPFGEAGIQLENMILVTENGYKVLNTIPNHMFVL
ncbi:MAG: Xaa-Pro peptidase family protein [Dehalobacterium sp.]